MCRTRDYKYVRRLYEQDELYDLRADPGELHNRIDDPALADVLAQLKERLLTFSWRPATSCRTNRTGGVKQGKRGEQAVQVVRQAFRLVSRSARRAASATWSLAPQPVY